MASRHRTAVNEVPRRGTYYSFGTTTTLTKPQYAPLQVCDDTVGQWETDNPLDLYKYVTAVPGMYGKQVSGGKVYREVDNVPIAYANQPCDPRTYFPVLTSNQLQAYASRTVSETNPSRPHINVPAAIGELKDVPDLVKSWGDNVIQGIANGHLWYTFGVRPLIGDLKKLTQFVTELNRLLRALKKLQTDGFITRRVVLDASVMPEICVAANVYLNTGCNFYIKGSRYISGQTKTWGSCRWILAGDLVLPDNDDDLERKLRSIVGGFNPVGALEAFWELIPWSWLVDWFVHVQDFLGTLHSDLPLTPEGVCIMRTCELSSRYTHDMSVQTVYNVDAELIGRHYEWGQRKERYPVVYSGLPTASIPLLSSGQWSILGSLAAIRLPHLGKKPVR